MPLSPCPICRRHVALAAAACPFCATPLSRADRMAWHRTALAQLAFGTALLAALVECSERPIRYPAPAPAPSASGTQDAGVEDATAKPLPVEADAAPEHRIVVAVYAACTVLIAGDVTFAEHSTRVSSEGQKVVQAVARVLQDHPWIERIRVIGRATPAEGKAGKWLAEQRARWVRDALLEQGIVADRVEAGAPDENDRREDGATTFTVLRTGRGAPSCD